MTSSDQPEIKRVGADGEETVPSKPLDEVLVASVPGDDPANFVVLTLSNPLNEKDRVRLGLPADGSTETGQKVAVNRNGAQIIINAGYATIDPEDREAVRSALRGEASRLSAPAAPEKPWYAVEVDETTTPNPVASEDTGVPSSDAPQPGADEDGFGGDAPEPADPAQGEPMVEPAAEGMMSPLDAPTKAPSTPGSTDPLTQAEASEPAQAEDAPQDKPADKPSNKRR